MSNRHPKHHRILAITPSSRGFGFAVIEGENTLVDWGVKSVDGDKNARSMSKMGEMIAHYQPDILVMENFDAKGSKRSARIRELGEQIITSARSLRVNVKLFSPEQVKQTFFEDGQGTKHTIAVILSRRFPEELDFRLPPKRKPWMSADYRMDIFDAVALALTFRMRREKRNPSTETQSN